MRTVQQETQAREHTTTRNNTTNHKRNSSHHRAVRQTSTTQHADVLAIRINRLDNYSRAYNGKASFKETMTKNKKKLELKAVITHAGTAHEGHYTVFTHTNGAWTKFNDALTSTAS